MKKLLITAYAVSCCMWALGQSKTERMLLGIVTRDSLLQAPFAEWFTKNYDAYHPNPTQNAGASINLHKNLRIEIFFGTWCGDSRRELPRMFKLLDAINWNPQQIKLIAVGNRDTLYKQSPGAEEKGKGLFRVPTFIIYDKDRELNRITEFPVYSLEKDMFQILGAGNYEGNYAALNQLQRWIQEGNLSDSNVSARGLALKIKPLVSNEHELNAAGNLLLKRNLKREALMAFRINANLYPESAMVMQSLGEAYLHAGDKPRALSALETSLGLLEKGSSQLSEILPLLYKAKGL